MISEPCAMEALKSAWPMEKVQQVALEQAMSAVNELRVFNEKYASDRSLEDNFDLIPAEAARPDEGVVLALSRYYLVLLNRRGLVGV